MNVSPPECNSSGSLFLMIALRQENHEWGNPSDEHDTDVAAEPQLVLARVKVAVKQTFPVT